VANLENGESPSFWNDHLAALRKASEAYKGKKARVDAAMSFAERGLL